MANAIAPTILAAVSEDKVEPFPLTLVNIPAVAPILPTLALPETLRLVNVPTLVILGCAAVVRTAAKPVLNVPELAKTKFVPMLPMLALPDTLNVDNVPTLVILG